MTGKQIEAAKKLLHMRYYGNDCIKPGVKWLKEDEIFREELSCREMINSILIYHESCEKGSYSYERYLLPYTQKGTWHDGLITEERLAQLIQEQKDDIAEAEIGFAGYDSEGVSYNYCKWADEK